MRPARPVGGPRPALRSGRAWHRHRPPSSQRGAVTVELAVGMVSVVALLAVVLGLVAAGVAQIRCVDAARAGARAAALGQEDEVVAAVARRSAGLGAQVTVGRDDGWVDVAVRLPVLGGPLLGDVTVAATASVPEEP